MDRGKDVITRDPLGNQDRIFEVVAVPGHERDQHVTTQSQFTQFGGRTISNDLTRAHRIPHAHKRALVDAGGLVGTHVLTQAIDINALRRTPRIRCAHNNTRTVDLIHHTITASTMAAPES